MIEIYFNRPVFEYDVHSLVKAFFPREEVELYYTFVEEEYRGRNLAVKHFKPGHRLPGERMPEGSGKRPPCKAAGSSEPGAVMHVQEDGRMSAEEPADVESGMQEFDILYKEASVEIVWWDGGRLHTSEFPVDYSDRREAKNAVKRGVYHLISDATGQKLPWGGLTGIRPTKLPMKLLEQGWEDERILSWMQDTYLVSPGKAALGLEIAKREREILADIDYENNYSLYVGIPFCPTTCLYCSFTSYPLSAWSAKVDEYLDAVRHELEFTAARCSGRKANTVYIGGGTPTTLNPMQMERLIKMIREYIDLSDCREFTVEAGRPDSITYEKLSVMKENGVDRISVNPQTMKQETLDLIGRRHTVQQVIDGYRMAREVGFDNINMDLIMGLPQEELSDAAKTLEAVEELAPDSVTVHSLAVKRAARLSAQWEIYRDAQMVNTQAHMDLCEEHCRRMGLSPYYLYRQKGMAGNLENVGYASEGKEGLYNILMMEEKQPIMAIGAGASTKLVLDRYNPDGSRMIKRIENVKDIRSYLERVDKLIEHKASRMEELGWR
ncbi:MAG: coproporphyrinogen dehydrogenase HemZ [Clostridiales bacterium]|nr:coproporphyrinogen dehydrogenase HemZ [Clostridiales bacterium]